MNNFDDLFAEVAKYSRENLYVNNDPEIKRKEIKNLGILINQMQIIIDAGKVSIVNINEKLVSLTIILISIAEDVELFEEIRENWEKIIKNIGEIIVKNLNNGGKEIFKEYLAIYENYYINALHSSLDLVYPKKITKILLMIDSSSSIRNYIEFSNFELISKDAIIRNSKHLFTIEKLASILIIEVINKCEILYYSNILSFLKVLNHCLENGRQTSHSTIKILNFCIKKSPEIYIPYRFPAISNTLMSSWKVSIDEEGKMLDEFYNYIELLKKNKKTSQLIRPKYSYRQIYPIIVAIKSKLEIGILTNLIAIIIEILIIEEVNILELKDKILSSNFKDAILPFGQFYYILIYLLSNEKKLLEDEITDILITKELKDITYVCSYIIKISEESIVKKERVDQIFEYFTHLLNFRSSLPLEIFHRLSIITILTSLNFNFRTDEFYKIVKNLFDRLLNERVVNSHILYNNYGELELIHTIYLLFTLTFDKDIDYYLNFLFTLMSSNNYELSKHAWIAVIGYQCTYSMKFGVKMNPILEKFIIENEMTDKLKFQWLLITALFTRLNAGKDNLSIYYEAGNSTKIRPIFPFEYFDFLNSYPVPALNINGFLMEKDIKIEDHIIKEDEENIISNFSNLFLKRCLSDLNIKKETSLRFFNSLLSLGLNLKFDLLEDIFTYVYEQEGSGKLIFEILSQLFKAKNSITQVKREKLGEILLRKIYQIDEIKAANIFISIVSTLGDELTDSGVGIIIISLIEFLKIHGPKVYSLGLIALNSLSESLKTTVNTLFSIYTPLILNHIKEDPQKYEELISYITLNLYDLSYKKYIIKNVNFWIPYALEKYKNTKNPDSLWPFPLTKYKTVEFYGKKYFANYLAYLVYESDKISYESLSYISGLNSTSLKSKIKSSFSLFLNNVIIRFFSPLKMHKEISIIDREIKKLIMEYKIDILKTEIFEKNFYIIERAFMANSQKKEYLYGVAIGLRFLVTLLDGQLEYIARLTVWQLLEKLISHRDLCKIAVDIIGIILNHIEKKYCQHRFIGTYLYSFLLETIKKNNEYKEAFDRFIRRIYDLSLKESGPYIKLIDDISNYQDIELIFKVLNYNKSKIKIHCEYCTRNMDLTYIPGDENCSSTTVETDYVSEIMLSIKENSNDSMFHRKMLSILEKRLLSLGFNVSKDLGIIMIKFLMEIINLPIQNENEKFKGLAASCISLIIDKFPELQKILTFLPLKNNLDENYELDFVSFTESCFTILLQSYHKSENLRITEKIGKVISNLIEKLKNLSSSKQLESTSRFRTLKKKVKIIEKDIFPFLRYFYAISPYTSSKENYFKDGTNPGSPRLDNIIPTEFYKWAYKLAKNYVNLLASEFGDDGRSLIYISLQAFPYSSFNYIIFVLKELYIWVYKNFTGSNLNFVEDCAKYGIMIYKEKKYECFLPFLTLMRSTILNFQLVKHDFFNNLKLMNEILPIYTISEMFLMIEDFQSAIYYGEASIGTFIRRDGEEFRLYKTIKTYEDIIEILFKSENLLENYGQLIGYYSLSPTKFPESHIYSSERIDHSFLDQSIALLINMGNKQSIDIKSYKNGLKNINNPKLLKIAYYFLQGQRKSKIHEKNVSEVNEELIKCCYYLEMWDDKIFETKIRPYESFDTSISRAVRSIYLNKEILKFEIENVKESLARELKSELKYKKTIVPNMLILKALVEIDTKKKLNELSHNYLDPDIDKHYNFLYKLIKSPIKEALPDVEDIGLKLSKIYRKTFKYSAALEICKELKEIKKDQQKGAIYCEIAKIYWNQGFKSESINLLYDCVNNKEFKISKQKYQETCLRLGEYLVQSDQAKFEEINKIFKKGLYIDKDLDLNEKINLKYAQFLLKFDNPSNQIEAFKHLLISIINGKKHFDESLPKFITLWINLAKASKEGKVEKDKLIENEIDKAVSLVNQIPTVSLVQNRLLIVSQLGQKIYGFREALVTMVKNMIRDYPAQTIWALAPLLSYITIEKKRDFERSINIPSLNGTNIIRDLNFFISLINNICKYKENCSKYSLKSVEKNIDSIFPLSIWMPTDKIYPIGKEVARIHKIEDIIENIESLRSPKKIVLVSSDGKKVTYLCKMKDDLRKDARFMDLMRILNHLIMSNLDAKRAIEPVITYSVYPLGEDLGILNWIENTITYENAISDAYKFCEINYNNLLNLCRTLYIGSKTSLECFIYDILPLFPPVLKQWFLTQFPTPITWYNARKTFTISCAIYSMIGAIMGLGDRHGLNILIDKNTGDCIHIDFGYLFEFGKFLKVPETVPFRLTNSMIDLFGPVGADGLFTFTSEMVLKIIRENVNLFHNNLETFIGDPLLEWKTEKKGICYDMNIAMNKLNDRLYGIFYNPKQVLSPLGQVKHLINEASSTKNLASMYFGWKPFI